MSSSDPADNWYAPLRRFFHKPEGVGAAPSIYMFTPRHLLYLLKTLLTKPGYFYHRVLVLYYQFCKPTAPWLTIDAIRILEQTLTKEMTGFEWGSGRSTVWLAKRVKALVSVEHNADWYATVRCDLANSGCTNVDYRLSGENSYVDEIRSFCDGTFDFILIDGEARSACISAAATKVKPGGHIFIDNADSGYKVTPLDRFTYHPTDNGVWRTDIYICPLD
jgi:hypothetical protein